MGQGIIVINPYKIPKESVHQANRLKDELEQLGVSVNIVTDTFLRNFIAENKIQTELKGIDFVIYLDKDKYQSEILEGLGIRLFNSHKAVRVCDDKGTTYLALLNSGLNIPKTIFGALCYNKDMPIDTKWAKKIAESLGYPLIIKESFGSMGKGVYLANNLDELIEVMEKVKLKPHLFQEHVGEPGVDVRVIVIGGKAVCAMERRNDTDFRSNVAQGGYGKKITLDGEFKKSAEKCALVLGLDYCGVDLLYGKDNKPYVCEVNSNAFISGIEKVTGFNVAKAYAEHIISCLNK
ncbi:MAG: RimK family alpha-L-glutamate ligase [Clostridiales bacterium]|nr:RimK family alpha-L-glutamate ligase [Clostridiales bacterium]